MNRKLRTALSAVMCTCALTMSVPAVATAGSIVTGTIQGMDLGGINASRTVNLTVVKQFNGPHDTEPFTGQRMVIRHLDGFDLTNPADWDRIRALTSEEAATLPGTTYTASIGDDGKAIFTDLPIGVYYVMEAEDNPHDPSGRYSEPFVVILPVADAETKGWEYDVVIHPKSRQAVLPRPPAPETTTTPPPDRGHPELVLPFIPLIIGSVLAGSASSGAYIPPVAVTTTPTPTPTPAPKKGIEKTVNRQLPITGANTRVLTVLALALVLAGIGIGAARRRRTS